MRREVAAGRDTGEHGNDAARAIAPDAVEGYLGLPYTIRITIDPTGGYVAAVEELPGCVTQAESWAEIGDMARDAMRAWISAALADGRPVPVPHAAAEPARILVRLPRSLHRDLLRAADTEGVSLNQYVVCELARAVGRQDR